MDPAAVAAAHEAELAPDVRRALGAWSTPGPLVEHVLDRVLPAPGHGPPPTVLDPACGTGMFLVAAVRRIAAGWRLSRRQAAERCVVGADVQQAAVAAARALLWADTGEAGPPPAGWLAGRLRVGDAFALDWPAADVVVGNPPYLSPLATATAPTADQVAAWRRRFGTAVSAYTDAAAVFALLALELVAPGGRVGLVLPQSLLSARDAAGARARLAETATLESLWVAGARMFDAAVLTCVATWRARPAGDAEPLRVRRFAGPAFAPLPDVVTSAGDLRGRPTWAHLVGDAFGVPAVPPPALAEAGRLGDLARTAADFRDQYYGLAPHVHEAADTGPRPTEAPLVTTGLIDPARCRWGRRATRFRGQRWARPVVDLDGLAATPLGSWAGSRLVPKVLVASQTKVLEAVVDAEGAWLPSVPVVSVVAPPDDLWHVAAALSSPLTSAWAAGTYLGAALTTTAIKLSARQVAEVPVPPTRPRAWDDAAEEVRRAHAAVGDDTRRAHLVAAGERMLAAAGVDGDDAVTLLRWWEARLP